MNPIHTNPKLGREYIDANEDAIISEMIGEMKAQMDRLYQGKPMLRQIHTKMHGCVKASFTIESNLPAEYQIGIFKEPKTYHAWVRFSNANTIPRADNKKDIRGIAIKLMNVPGEKILNDEYLETTQDFLLMSSETFFSKNLKEFRTTLKASTAKNKVALLLYLLNPSHLGLFKRLMQSMIKCENPLTIPYWSTQAHQFGDIDVAVKYFLRPQSENCIVNASFKDPNYLRYNLVQTLYSNDASFDFCIQMQTNADTMPIEDPTIAWTSPDIKLATLRIIPQEFDSNVQIEFGENLSFNAWHSLPAHRPLGSFNRARKRVYEAMSRYRHEKNNTPVFEPSDSPDFLKLDHSPIHSSALDHHIPTDAVIVKVAEITMPVSKKVAFDYISSSIHLTEWLHTSGPIKGAKKVELLDGPYDRIGAQRRVTFEDNSSVIEELLSYHPVSNYSYSITHFSTFFKRITRAAYGQVWIDTVNDLTRVRWVYSFTFMNFLDKIFLKIFLGLFYHKFMQKALDKAQVNILASNK